MNILFSITYYHPYISGLTECVRRLAEALAGRGHRVSLLSMQHDLHSAERERLSGVSVVRAKPLIRVSKGFLSLDWFVKSVQMAQASDVVFINLPQPEGWIPALAAKIAGKKVVAIYHCEVVLPDGFRNSIIQSLLEIANMVTLLLADRVVTYTKDFAKNSKVLTARFPELTFPQFRESSLKKLFFIYPPISEPAASDRVTALLKKKIGSADRVIGFLGRLAAEKGVEYLLETVPMLNAKCQMLNKKFKIAVAGPMAPVGEEAYRRKILWLAKKYRRKVVFLGEIPDGCMGSFYRLLDVLVLPSINSTEAFGMVQVEAMLSGVPVVATNLPGVRVPVQQTGMGIVVPPKKSHALAFAISKIVQHKERYIKPKDVIGKEFSFTQSIDAYEQLL